jgi:methylase of polypeptide subunit release factors
VIAAQTIPIKHAGTPARELMRFCTLQFFRYIHTRTSTYQLRLAGKTIKVTPSVFTPSYRGIVSLKASELLALNLQVPPGARVLDMGTGTGIQAMFAAERASEVIACDINPAAVECAQDNAATNRIRKMEVRCGDLFEPVKGELFDFVVWLPPSFFIDPITMSDRAFMCGADGEILSRFFREVGSHLRKDGKVQFSCVDRTRSFILPLLRKYRFHWELIKTVRRPPMETVTQYVAWLE